MAATKCFSAHPCPKKAAPCLVKVPDKQPSRPRNPVPDRLGRDISPLLLQCHVRDLSPAALEVVENPISFPKKQGMFALASIPLHPAQGWSDQLSNECQAHMALILYVHINNPNL